MIDAHLHPAPLPLQAEARRVILKQAAEYQARVEQASKQPASWSVAMEEIDAKFSHRLRVLCAERLERGEGLLVVGDFAYDKRKEGKKFLLWSDGRRQFNRNTDVLIVVDEADRELETYDQQYWDARAVQLAEVLIPFNGLPFETRSARIKAFLGSKAKGAPDGSHLGVENAQLHYLEIDPNTMTVVPRAR